MKKFLNTGDMIFLRIIPTIYFVISLCATVVFSVQNWSEGISVMGIMTDNVVVTLCFLLLVIHPLLLRDWHQIKTKPKK